MKWKENWEETKQKYLEYWSRENHDRPIISVTAPRNGYVPKMVKGPENLRDRWLDTEYVIKKARENFNATYFGGESFPQLWPNLGPDIFGAILGCDLEFGQETSWAENIIDSWGNVKDFKFDPENKWWKKIKQMTEDIAADSKGDYIVGITDIHPGIDGIVSLRGPENVCLDLIDNPEAIKKANFQLFDIFKKVTDELYDITTRNQYGSSNWMGVWHPGKWYVTSCDFICMISQDMAEEFVLPELIDEIKYLDASIYHLDGPGALKHLDRLLEIPELKGIQWVYGAGQPTASHWIPVLKKIQDAGKTIHVDIVPEEIDILLQELKPEGVFFSTRCRTEEEAREIVKKAEKAYKKKYI